jgi:Fe2+ transport system protein FeoA
MKLIVFISMKKFILKKIESSSSFPNADLVKRLYDMGLHPGIEVEIIAKISFNSVTIVQYGSTRLALNEEEFACLRGH